MKLTIAIPTFNRASCLDRCLKSLKENFNNNFKVLIYDNNSEDNTYEIVKNHINNGLPITYHKNDENLGWTRNFELCFKAVSTEYMILLGDDDILFKDSIRYILKEIELNNPDLIFLKALPLTTLRKNFNLKNNSFNHFGRNDFVCETILQFRLISSYVIKTKHINTISSFDGNFAHLEVIFENLRKGKKFSVTKGCFIGSLVNNSDFADKVRFSDIYVVEFFNLFRNNLNNILAKVDMVNIENIMLRLYYPKLIVKSRIGLLPYDEKVKYNFEKMFSSNDFYTRWKFLINHENFITTFFLIVYVLYMRLIQKLEIYLK